MSQTLSIRGNSSELSVLYYPPIELDSDYYLGLIGFQTWNSIPNIEENINNCIKIKNVIIKIPTGSYEITDIEKNIQSQILQTIFKNDIIKEQEIENPRKFFSLEANNNTLKCEINSKFDVDFNISNSIGTLLGYSPKLYKANKIHESDLPIKIINVTSIRIECNLTSSAYYNQIPSHTLFEFSPNVEPGYKISIEPRNIVYLPICTNNIDNITLRIVDQDGRLINFRGEDIVVRLELKRK